MGKSIVLCCLLVVICTASCAVTGIRHCDENNLGKYKCNRIVCLVEQCQKTDSGEFKFQKIDFTCSQVNKCQCEAGWICKEFRCAYCEQDGSSFHCDVEYYCENPGLQGWDEQE